MYIMFPDDADAVMSEGFRCFNHCTLIEAFTFVFTAADVHLALIPSACAFVDFVVRYLVQRSGVLVVYRRRIVRTVAVDVSARRNFWEHLAAPCGVHQLCDTLISPIIGASRGLPPLLPTVTLIQSLPRSSTASISPRSAASSERRSPVHLQK